MSIKISEPFSDLKKWLLGYSLVQQRLNKAASRKAKTVTPRQETPLERQVWPRKPVQPVTGVGEAKKIA